jgi:hypothetical protein
MDCPWTRIYHSPAEDNRSEIYWWAPFAFVMFIIVYVHRLQRARGLRLERYTYYGVTGVITLTDSPGQV